MSDAASDGPGTARGRPIRAFVTYSEGERRAAMNAVNLFFSALLGASLGAMGEMPLERYALTIMLLVAAVSSVFVIAYSERGSTIISTSLCLALVLMLCLWSPSFRLPDEMQRLSVALLIWVLTLLATRFWPTASPSPAARHDALDPQDQDA